MKRAVQIAGALLLSIAVPAAMAGGFGHSIAVGGHYFKVLGDIKAGSSFEKDGVGYNVSYRLGLSRVFSIEAVLQGYPAGYYDAEEVYSPEVYAVLGRGLYAGIGALAYHVRWHKDFRSAHDASSEWTDVTYALIAGVEIPLVLDFVALDLNARYVFNEWQEVEDFQEDTLTFGGRVRLYLSNP
jgi:opacity protein-like surface antigen